MSQNLISTHRQAYEDAHAAYKHSGIKYSTSIEFSSPAMHKNHSKINIRADINNEWWEDVTIGVYKKRPDSKDRELIALCRGVSFKFSEIKDDRKATRNTLLEKFKKLPLKHNDDFLYAELEFLLNSLKGCSSINIEDDTYEKISQWESFPDTYYMDSIKAERYDNASVFMIYHVSIDRDMPARLAGAWMQTAISQLYTGRNRPKPYSLITVFPYSPWNVNDERGFTKTIDEYLHNYALKEGNCLSIAAKKRPTDIFGRQIMIKFY